MKRLRRLSIGIGAGAVAAIGAPRLAFSQVPSASGGLQDMLTYTIQHGFTWLGGLLCLLVALHLIRGKHRIEGGWVGEAVLRRYGRIERANHWLLAASFAGLAISGTAALYGHRIGLTAGGLPAWFHRSAGIAYVLALVVAFAQWVRHAVPNRYDVAWMMSGGMLFGRHKQPPAKKFNASQKLMFWFVMVAGAVAAMTGHAWLPIDASLSRGIHGAAGIALILVVVVHIYFRTIGIEGAFDAIRSGDVDLNWAKQHHQIWAEEELSKAETSHREASR